MINMTIEETIERLNLILETDKRTLNGFNIPHEPLEKEIEALNIAIKALDTMRKYQQLQEVLEKIWNIPNHLNLTDKAQCLDRIMETYKEVR